MKRPITVGADGVQTVDVEHRTINNIPMGKVWDLALARIASGETRTDPKTGASRPVTLKEAVIAAFQELLSLDVSIPITVSTESMEKLGGYLPDAVPGTGLDEFFASNVTATDGKTPVLHAAGVTVYREVKEARVSVMALPTVSDDREQNRNSDPIDLPANSKWELRASFSYREAISVDNRED